MNREAEEPIEMIRFLLVLIFALAMIGLGAILTWRPEEAPRSTPGTCEQPHGSPHQQPTPEPRRARPRRSRGMLA